MDAHGIKSCHDGFGLLYCFFEMAGARSCTYPVLFVN